MIMKRATKVMLADKLHRGFVYTCLAATLIGTAQLFSGIVNYYVVVKPQHEEEARKDMAELLKEGREIIDEVKNSL